MTRGLNRPGTASRKRTHEGGSDENDPSKRAKGSNGAAPAPASVAAQDTTPMANAAPGGGAPMTAEQIRAMMSNARKEILVRQYSTCLYEYTSCCLLFSYDHVRKI